jgi:hypothetical protein
MAEWFKALGLKLNVCNSTVGSNPTLSSLIIKQTFYLMNFI